MPGGTPAERRAAVLQSHCPAADATAAAAAAPPPKAPAHAADVLAAGRFAPLPNRRPGDKKGAGGKSSFFIAGNWAPVGESREAIPLRGAPADLSGTFLRVGPNPAFDYGGKPYHPFDGDGMVHTIRFAGGAAQYRSAFVRTRKLDAALRLGFQFSGFGELAGSFTKKGSPPSLRHARYEVDAKGEGMGPANTALVYHAGRLLALHEGDKPYSMDLASLDTRGREDWGGELRHPFTAHPKQCPVTGELFSIGYQAQKKPWLHYAVHSADGRLLRSVPVQLPGPTMMHDLVITRTRILLLDWNMRFDMKAMFADLRQKGESTGPWRWLGDRPARFGVIRRDAAPGEEVVWIDVPACSVIHFANAWDEGADEVVVCGCRSDGGTGNLDFDKDIDMGHEQYIATAARLHMWRLDVARRALVSDRPLGGHPCEFPQVDGARVGLPTRYVYAAEMAGLFNITAALKYDLRTGETLRYEYGAGAVAGEAVFARRSGGSGEEDDGYLVSFVRAPGTEGAGECRIVDARTMRLAASLRVPAFVPHGFHAYWVGKGAGFPSE